MNSWPAVVRHVFDSVWGVVGTGIGAFLAGWLLVNKPNFLKKADDPTKL